MDNEEIFIIAEIGKNFIQTKEEKSVEEYLENAKKLIDAAVEAGVDAVKFQTHEIEDEQLNIDVVSPHFKGSDRYSWVRRNTLSTPIEFWREVKNYCDKKKIIFFSTPMSRKAAMKIDDLVSMWKIGSGDVDDFVMLDYMMKTKKPIILSSGMVSLSELRPIMAYLKQNQVDTTLFYCVSLYPCPKEKFNLSTIEYFKENYPEAKIGFSDHSLGYEVVLPAIKLGAQVIEKHFSFSRDFWGADHKVSMEPREMAEMVKAIRNKKYEQAEVGSYYGDKQKELEGSDNIFRKYFKKGLVMGEDALAGAVIKPEMVYAMRPWEHIQNVGGMPASQFVNVVGKQAKIDLKKYEILTPGVLI